MLKKRKDWRKEEPKGRVWDGRCVKERVGKKWTENHNKS
jgi:hypothetical protein